MTVRSVRGVRLAETVYLLRVNSDKKLSYRRETRATLCIISEVDGIRTHCVSV